MSKDHVYLLSSGHAVTKKSNWSSKSSVHLSICQVRQSTIVEHHSRIILSSASDAKMLQSALNQQVLEPAETAELQHPDLCAFRTKTLARPSASCSVLLFVASAHQGRWRMHLLTFLARVHSGLMP